MGFYKYILIFILFFLLSCIEEKQNGERYFLDKSNKDDLIFVDYININDNLICKIEVIDFIKIDSFQSTKVIITASENKNLLVFSLNPLKEIFSFNLNYNINDIIAGDSGLLIIFKNGLFNYISYYKLGKYEGIISQESLYPGFYFNNQFFIIDKLGCLYIINENDFNLNTIYLSDITGVGIDYYEIYDENLFILSRELLYCIDLKDNTIKYSKRITSLPFSFEYSKEKIYISCQDGSVKVYDSIDNSKISITNHSIGSFIEIKDNSLYYLSHRGLLTKYSLDIGINMWQKKLDKFIYLKPIFYQNKIILASYDGYLLIINSITGELIKEKKIGIDINDFKLYKDYIIILDYSGRINVYKII